MDRDLITSILQIEMQHEKDNRSCLIPKRTEIDGWQFPQDALKAKSLCTAIDKMFHYLPMNTTWISAIKTCIGETVPLNPFTSLQADWGYFHRKCDKAAMLLDDVKNDLRGNAKGLGDSITSTLIRYHKNIKPTTGRAVWWGCNDSQQIFDEKGKWPSVRISNGSRHKARAFSWNERSSITLCHSFAENIGEKCWIYHFSGQDDRFFFLCSSENKIKQSCFTSAHPALISSAIVAMLSHLFPKRKHTEAAQHRVRALIMFGEQSE